MTPTEELLHIVDHLIRQGAVALEVVHGASSVKCNLVRASTPGLLTDECLDASAEFEKSLYYSAEQEELEK